MTIEQYYVILKERWEKVDKDNLEEIKAYNRYARMLRKNVEEQEDE